MRSLSVLVLFISMLCSSPVLAGQFGPAQAQTKPGQVSLGVGAFAYSDVWDFEGISEDVRQTEAFVQLNLGLFPGWEIYLRGGGADVSSDEIMGGADFKDSLAPFATAGLKGLFVKGKYFDFGGFAEASYFSEYKDSNSDSLLIIEEELGVNAGLTFQKEIEGAILYGGPFFHYREADFYLNYPTINPITFVPERKTLFGTAEEDGNLGAFLGIRWIANKDIVVEIEVQRRNNYSAGAAVSLLF